MTPNQLEWARERDRLARALSSAGFPAELADLLARQLKSPKAIGRMAGYVEQARPRSMEMIADEMLAICAQIDTWRDKKASEEAQAGYSAWLSSPEREELGRE